VHDKSNDGVMDKERKRKGCFQEHTHIQAEKESLRISIWVREKEEKIASDMQEKLLDYRKKLCI
jgi:hypothetical protein